MQNLQKETELKQLENIIRLSLDVSNPKEIRTTIAKTISFQSIDIVFNNSNYRLLGALEGLSDQYMMQQPTTI